MVHQFLFNPYILDNVPIPTCGFDVVQDTTEPRLRMYVTSRGVKSFFVRKRVNGKDKRIILGKYPSMDVIEARKCVPEILKSVSQKSKTHHKKISFRKIADMYLVKKVRRTDEAKTKLVRSIMIHLSQLFEENIKDITTENIYNILSNIEGMAVRNRMQELLQSIFNYAIDDGYVAINPVARLPKIQEERRIRPLNQVGFDRLFNVINKEPSQNLRAAFLMLIYGFAPRSKTFSMRWRDLNFNHYTWKDQPLSDAAVVLLQDLPQDGKWVFPGRGGQHLTDPRMAWKRIAVKAKIPNLTMDDVYKFLNRQLIWGSDREIFRMNMNAVIENVIPQAI